MRFGGGQRSLKKVVGGLAGVGEFPPEQPGVGRFQLSRQPPHPVQEELLGHFGMEHSVEMLNGLAVLATTDLHMTADSTSDEQDLRGRTPHAGPQHAVGYAKRAL